MWLLLPCRTGIAQAPGGEVDFKYVLGHQPMAPAAIPDLKLEVPEKCGHLALRYGPGVDEVAYLIVDREARSGRYEKLCIFAPACPKYAKPFRMSGAKDGRWGIKFRDFRLNSRFGNVLADYEVELDVLGARVDILIRCSLKREGRWVARFTLERREDLAVGVGEKAEVIEILDQPSVSCTLDHRSSPPKLSGSLKMGKWSLTPGSKMPSRLSASVVSEDGRRAIRETAKLCYVEGGKFRFEPQRPMIPGKSYEACVSVYLGPAFGELTEKKRIVPRHE